MFTGNRLFIYCIFSVELDLRRNISVVPIVDTCSQINIPAKIIDIFNPDNPRIPDTGNVQQSMSLKIVISKFNRYGVEYWGNIIHRHLLSYYNS